MQETQTPQIHWTTATLALLGKMSDSALAIRMNTTSVKVRRKRIDMGIAPWRAAITAKLDRERKCSMSGNQPRQTRLPRRLIPITQAHIDAAKSHAVNLPAHHWWTEAEIDRLGTMSDERLARKIGVPASEVRFMRIKLCIKIWRPKSNHQEK